MIVVDAVAGIEVQTEKAWKFAEQFKKPVLFVVNRMDRERASLERCIADLQKKFGRGVLALQIPVGSEKSFHGTIDLVRMEAHLLEDGKRKDEAIPEEYRERAEVEHKNLVEMVAEGEDHLMEKFFANGTLDASDLLPGLQEEVSERKVFPVMCVSANLEIGVLRLLDACVALLPSPDGTSVAAKDKDGKDVLVKGDDTATPLAQVFKTISDPFSGRITYFRVFSGTFKSDGTYWNSSRSAPERFSGLFLPQGKEHVVVPELRAGDIGAVAKLKDTFTGDSLATKDHPLQLPAITFPEPAIAFAIEAKAKADEDKISNALHKLIEEDPSLHFERDEETKEFHLSGAGQLHVEIAVARLKKRYNVEVILHPPKVPYRETITRKAEAHGRHKKQSGGHGHFADCRIEVSPLPRGSDFQFENDIFGGAIPRNFIPAVEKGIQDAARRYLAGPPDGRFQGPPLRRAVPRRGFLGDGVQDRGVARVPGGHVQGRTDDPRTGHAGRGLCAGGIHGGPHGRSLLTARPGPGHGRRGRPADHSGSRSHGRDAHLRLDAPVDHPGPGGLPHGLLPLRRGAGPGAGKDRRGVRQEADRRSRGVGAHTRTRGQVAAPLNYLSPRERMVAKAKRRDQVRGRAAHAEQRQLRPRFGPRARRLRMLATGSRGCSARTRFRQRRNKSTRPAELAQRTRG